MKSTKLRINKKTRLRGIRKLKKEINEIVGDCLDDIKYYIIDDIMNYLKKKGVVVYAKNKKTSKENKKTKKREKTKKKNKS